MNAVTEAEVDALMDVYREKYDFATDNLDAIRYQAREEIAMKKMMDRRGLQGLRQHLPGPLRHGAAARSGLLST